MAISIECKTNKVVHQPMTMCFLPATDLVDQLWCSQAVCVTCGCHRIITYTITEQSEPFTWLRTFSAHVNARLSVEPHHCVYIHCNSSRYDNKTSTQHHKDAKSRNTCVVVSCVYLAKASSLRLFCLGGPLSGELLGSRLRPLPPLAGASFMPLPLPLPRLPAHD